MGRPSSFTQEIADSICESLADGKSLREVCRKDGSPGFSTVMAWLKQRPEFQEQYARAKEIGIEVLADEILDIADDGSNDWMKRHGRDDEESWVFNGEAARRSQIRIDARRWLLSKLAPKKYGEKVDISASGTITVNQVVRRVVDPKCDP